MSQRDVLALGQKIVAQLELDDRGAVLERWMAHHIAELITAAETSKGPEAKEAAQQASDTILKLWAQRRTLPPLVDPLGGYRGAMMILSQLMPDKNPWVRYSGIGAHLDLLRSMFDSLTRTMVAAILLTQATRARPIADVERAAIDEDERQLHAALEEWAALLPVTPEMPDLKIQFIEDDGSVSETESGAQQGESSDEEMTTDPSELVALRLEEMIKNMNNLLRRWRQTQFAVANPDVS